MVEVSRRERLRRRSDLNPNVARQLRPFVISPDGLLVFGAVISGDLAQCLSPCCQHVHHTARPRPGKQLLQETSLAAIGDFSVREIRMANGSLPLTLNLIGLG